MISSGRERTPEYPEQQRREKPAKLIQPFSDKATIRPLAMEDASKTYLPHTFPRNFSARGGTFAGNLRINFPEPCPYDCRACFFTALPGEREQDPVKYSADLE